MAAAAELAEEDLRAARTKSNARAVSGKRGPGVPVGAAVHEEIIRMRESGATWRTIQQTLRVHKATVMKVLKNAGMSNPMHRKRGTS